MLTYLLCGLVELQCSLTYTQKWTLFGAPPKCLGRLSEQLVPFSGEPSSLQLSLIQYNSFQNPLDLFQRFIWGKSYGKRLYIGGRSKELGSDWTNLLPISKFTIRFFFVPSENVTPSGFLLMRGATPDTTHQNPMVTNNAQYCLAKFLPRPVRREAKTSLLLTKPSELFFLTF